MSDVEVVLTLVREVVGRDVPRDAHEPLGGLLDSFQAIQLVSILEVRFAIELAPQDFEHADWASASSIATLVARVRARRIAEASRG